MSEISALEAELSKLILPAFTEETALELGEVLVSIARDERLAVVIDIRTPDRTLFHAALPGSTPMNDLWARRKSAAALMFHEASLIIGLRNAQKDRDLAYQGLDPMQHADHGGAVPIRVAGAGVVAVATVSGLPSRDDHDLVVRALAKLVP
ncbi:heme-degrading domain-containing protein [Fuscibacter oryzae]|uniref:Heme-degrading domain-containing protein n=1 Tax=Fuscibacter oryzae TaxID=2803939 RepID=A0A8J7MS87_9RHOB|nr:heme-degrading domain-containing protein [Fuscibacter oryzae]MBL4929388.1 heme-degrading domain-containing protein [Fuscibacter oryzae]